MSILKLPKQLLPAKKTWKRITTMLKSKLKKFKLRKAIKSSTNRLASFRPLGTISFKRRAVSKRKSFSSSRFNHHSLPHYNHVQKGYAAVYIDQLCTDSTSTLVHAKHDACSAHAGTSRAEKQVVQKVSNKNGNDNPVSIEDAWRTVLARSPQLRCVNERAEEFITNFKQEMRLQKEISLLEFQERLARSA